MKAALDGKIILISGASTGIGRAAAVDLARLGARVFAGVRNPDAGKKIESEAKGLRGRLSYVLLDVADEKSSAQAVSRIIDDSGRIDGLINNAGIAVAGPCEALRMKDYRAQFEVNVFGAIALTQLCLAHLRATRGRIVMVSSVNGKIASPFLSAYAASKFALEGFSDSLRRELTGFGIKVSIIEPGPIQTPIWEKSEMRGDEILSQTGADIRAAYEAPLAAFRESVAHAITKARPVDEVLKALRHAFCDANPKTRYVIGNDNLVAVRLAEMLPDRLMDGLMLREISRRSKS